MAIKGIDFADVCAERLREAGFADARVRKLADVSEGGIAVRRMPSTKTADYFTGDRAIDYVVQVVVARESEAQAIDECCAAADLLPTLDLSSGNGSYAYTSAEVYTEPQELSQGAVAVWETRIRARITAKERTE